MSETERPRGNGANPNAVVYHDSAEPKPNLKDWQASRLMRRCPVSEATALMLAPLVYGERAA